MIKLDNFGEKNGHFKINFYKGNSTFRRYYSIRLAVFLHIYISMYISSLTKMEIACFGN